MKWNFLNKYLQKSNFSSVGSAGMGTGSFKKVSQQFSGRKRWKKICHFIKEKVWQGERKGLNKMPKIELEICKKYFFLISTHTKMLHIYIYFSRAFQNL